MVRSAPTVRVSRSAMGSIFEIVLTDKEEAALTAIGSDTLDRVGWLEQQFSHFLPDSDICRINALAGRESVPVASNTFSLLKRCRQWSADTEGAFDCTAGKLVRLWGFFKQGIVRGDPIDLPDADAIEKIVRKIGWKFVELDEANSAVRFHSPEVELHLGAVGKGFIVQTAADYLRAQGIQGALLHCGQSSAVAVGSPPEGSVWKIGLDASNRIANGLHWKYAHAAVLLSNASLSVSGNTEIFVTSSGERFGHLFDPRTGHPVSGLSYLALIAPDAAEGDALSTAFAVNGLEWTKNFIANRPELSAVSLDDAPEPNAVHLPGHAVSHFLI